MTERNTDQIVSFLMKSQRTRFLNEQFPSGSSQPDAPSFSLAAVRFALLTFTAVPGPHLTAAGKILGNIQENAPQVQKLGVHYSHGPTDIPPAWGNPCCCNKVPVKDNNISPQLLPKVLLCICKGVTSMEKNMQVEALKTGFLAFLH